MFKFSKGNTSLLRAIKNHIFIGASETFTIQKYLKLDSFRGISSFFRIDNRGLAAGEYAYIFIQFHESSAADRILCEKRIQTLWLADKHTHIACPNDLLRNSGFSVDAVALSIDKLGRGEFKPQTYRSSKVYSICCLCCTAILNHSIGTT